MNILVTGATGFIGKNLVKELVKLKDTSVFCLVRKTSNVNFLKQLKVCLIYADISKYSSLSSIKNIDIIYHCAAYVGNKNKKLLETVNVKGTQNICRLALNLKVKRFIYLSSVAVISGNKIIPLNDNLCLKASNPYGESKLKAEKIVLEYRNKKGLPTVILRPSMVYGKGEPHLTLKALRLIKLGIIPLFGNGKNFLHLLHVKTLINVMIYALEEKEFLKGTFIVADKKILSLKQVLDLMASACNTKIKLKIPESVAVIMSYLPFIGKTLKSFRKNRMYSIERLESLELKDSYKTKESLYEVFCDCFKDI